MISIAFNLGSGNKIAKLECNVFVIRSDNFVTPAEAGVQLLFLVGTERRLLPPVFK